MFTIGDKIKITALKADGTAYRSWFATVQYCYENLIVTTTPANDPFEEILENRAWCEPYHRRCFFWTDKMYNLFEVYKEDMELLEIYINVSSPVKVTGDGLEYYDYELDVVKRAGSLEPVVEDIDEFEEAIRKYNYSMLFQNDCWTSVEKAKQLANDWLIIDYGPIK